MEFRLNVEGAGVRFELIEKRIGPTTRMIYVDGPFTRIFMFEAASEEEANRVGESVFEADCMIDVITVTRFLLCIDRRED